MKKTSTIFLTIVFLTFLASCTQESAKPAKEESKLVKTMLVNGHDIDLLRTYPGRVSAGQKAVLSFLVSGKLITLLVKEGDKVNKGQLIAQIDPQEFEIMAAQEKAKYDLAKITFERYKQLLPTKAISISEYDEKKSLYELSKAQYDQTLKALTDTKLFAPFSGIIAKRFVDNYEYVQAKQPVVSLQDFSNLEIIVNIPEQDLSRSQSIQRLKTKEGQSIIIGEANFVTIPNVSFPVKIKEVSTEADSQTQTYQVVFSMPLPEKLIILPGMTANVTVNFSEIDSHVVYVPTDAVLFDAQGHAYVWLVNLNDMTVHQQTVTVGDMQNGKIRILTGIEKSQTIVVAGGAYLHEGMKVKMIKGRIGR